MPSASKYRSMRALSSADVPLVDSPRSPRYCRNFALPNVPTSLFVTAGNADGGCGGWCGGAIGKRGGIGKGGGM